MTNNNSVEHVVHTVPPRSYYADPKSTILDSLVTIADKQRSINNYTLHSIDTKNVIELTNHVHKLNKDN